MYVQDENSLTLRQGTKTRSLTTSPMAHFIHCSRRTYSTQRAATCHPYIPLNTHPRIFPLFNPYALDVILFWELDGDGRCGHILVPGLTLGARHGYLDHMIDNAESAKVKRSMYAETQRERSEILRAIRESEWDAEMDPTVVTNETAGTIRHDFSKGWAMSAASPPRLTYGDLSPCRVSVQFHMKNLSPTHLSRVTLRLAATPSDVETSYVSCRLSQFRGRADDADSVLLSPRYIGRLTHRAEIQPRSAATVHTKVWVTRPGSFRLSDWTVETQVDTSERTSIRHLRYIQVPPVEHLACFSVIDTSHS